MDKKKTTYIKNFAHSY